MTKYRFVVLLPLMALTGCSWFDGLFDDSSKTPLTGERISVLSLERRLEPDPSLAQVDVRLPRPDENPDWPQAGGYPNHAMQHLALGDNVKRIWSSSVGDGAHRYGRVIAQPIVAKGKVFALDAIDEVYALDAATGRRAWTFDTQPDGARANTYGGGLAFDSNQLYVATGYGQLIALNPDTGKELWRQQLSAPVHGAPTVADGRVFAVTVNNQLDVMAADDGRRLWTHNGIPETAGLQGDASPAVEGDIVVVPYSSGEVFALRVENGRPVWTDNLATSRRFDAVSTMADIRGRPVIDRGRVLAISHSGRLVSIDLRTGERVWEQEIGGVHSPWVAGDFVYVLTNEGEVVCLARQDGRVRWVQGLPRYENEKKKKDPIQWAGPVLGGDRLIVVGSNGDALSLSPYTGKALGRVDLPDGTFIAPVLAGNTLYVLTEDADLVALR